MRAHVAELVGGATFTRVSTGHAAPPRITVFAIPDCASWRKQLKSVEPPGASHVAVEMAVHAPDLCVGGGGHMATATATGGGGGRAERRAGCRGGAYRAHWPRS